MVGNKYILFAGGSIIVLGAIAIASKRKRTEQQITSEPIAILPTKEALVQHAPEDAPRKLPGRIKQITRPTGVNPTQEVFRLTNEYRNKYNISALAWSGILAKSASAHAQDMAARGYFAHNSPEGSQPQDRILAAGWTTYPVGENIAAGQATPQDVMQGWIASPGHRENLVRREFKHIGIGYFYAQNSKYGHYWVQNFGG